MDMKRLMKQMQQAQSAASKIQEDLAEKMVEGTASGLVSVTVNGHGKLQSLKIDKNAVDGDDVEALEDLIVAAIRDAESKVDELQQEATQGLRIPGF